MSGKRALIVDDSTTAQYRLKKMLRAYDLDIDIVDSGEAALLFLAKHVPDVIFMDHQMPGMDGFRALQIIKSHPETAMVPVIMYTAKSGDVFTGQARALGALDVISKDTVDAVELSKVMSSIHIEPHAKPRADDEAPPTETLPRPVPLATADNSRRIELRIVQLEHAIDDSRRINAAQLIREMQKLRQGLKQELGALFDKHKTENVVSTTDAAITEQRTPWLTSLLLGLCIVLLVLLAWLGFQLRESLADLQTRQAPQEAQLSVLTDQLLDVQMDILGQQPSSPVPVSPAISTPNLDDFVWAFNQSGHLAFSSRLVDASTLIRLSEFVERLSRQDFRGTLWINLSIGNFCVLLDNYGLAQLPDAEVTLAQCLLLSEVYPLEGMASELVEDIQESLLRNPAVSRGDILVITNRIDHEAVGYPPRDAPLLAREWNQQAFNHHRMTVLLRPTVIP